jgi:hypothetical protein
MGGSTNTERSPTRRSKARGIFCLEDDWFGDMRHSSSLEPVLHLLNRWYPYFVPYIHRDAATPESIEYYLRKWLLKSYNGYPILYLALHGSPGTLHVGSGRRDHYELPFQWLEDQLAGRCGGRIIFVASCSTLEIHGNRLNRFLRRTNALAVCGYTGYIDWLRSSTFDALVLAAFQDNAMSRAGVKAMRRRIIAEGRGLANELCFRMVVKA